MSEIARDWREIHSTPKHEFYIIPKPPKNTSESVEDMHVIELEKRKTKRGDTVYTYAVVIARKRTKDNPVMAGLLFVKVLVDKYGNTKVYYNIVKMPLYALWLLIQALERAYDMLKSFPDEKIMDKALYTTDIEEVVNYIVDNMTKSARTKTLTDFLLKQK